MSATFVKKLFAGNNSLLVISRKRFQVSDGQIVIMRKILKKTELNRKSITSVFCYKYEVPSEFFKKFLFFTEVSQPSYLGNSLTLLNWIAKAQP